MSRSYAGLLGPKLSATEFCDGFLFSSIERAWSDSHSYRRNQRSGSSSVKAYGGHSLPFRHRASAEPVLAVGEDAHAHAALLFRLRQVVISLVNVLGIGVEAARGADPAFETR